MAKRWWPMADAFVSLTRADQLDALGVAATNSGRPVHLLEKDVWVVWAVDALFSSPFGEHVVFKGGTSLSKGYDIIKRFSEDVDVTYDVRQLLPEFAGEKPLRDALPRARAAIEKASPQAAEITPRKEGPVSAVRLGIMHLAKGLEFRAVAVMACDEDLLPLKERIEAVADEVELDDVYATERQLLYVVCTRARDRLLITGLRPGSEFLSDFRTS